MRIVRYLDETGNKLTIGEVTVSGLKIEVSFLRPDINSDLIQYLKKVSEQGYVEVLWPREFEGGIAEEIVQIKPNSKYFWPSLRENLSFWGYTLEN